MTLSRLPLTCSIASRSGSASSRREGYRHSSRFPASFARPSAWEAFDCRYVALVTINGQMSLRVLLRAFEGTVRTTCMVMLIVIAAFFLNFVMVSIGLVKAITDMVLSLGWSPLAMLLAIVVFYLLLGSVMETLSMMIATTPVVVPVIKALGYSPVWWGIIFVILMEAALITPPVGLNLYVVQAVRGRGAFSEICLGALPFVLMMIIMIAILIAFPQLALWLPTILNPKAG